MFFFSSPSQSVLEKAVLSACSPTPHTPSLKRAQLAIKTKKTKKSKILSRISSSSCTPLPLPHFPYQDGLPMSSHGIVHSCLRPTTCRNYRENPTSTTFTQLTSLLFFFADPKRCARLFSSAIPSSRHPRRSRCLLSPYVFPPVSFFILSAWFYSSLFLCQLRSQLHHNNITSRPISSSPPPPLPHGLKTLSFTVSPTPLILPSTSLFFKKRSGSSCSFRCLSPKPQHLLHRTLQRERAAGGGVAGGREGPAMSNAWGPSSRLRGSSRSYDDRRGGGDGGAGIGGGGSGGGGAEARVKALERDGAELRSACEMLAQRVGELEDEVVLSRRQQRRLAELLLDATGNAGVGGHGEPEVSHIFPQSEAAGAAPSRGVGAAAAEQPPMVSPGGGGGGGGRAAAAAGANGGEPVFCYACGASRVPGSRFCQMCGITFSGGAAAGAQQPHPPSPGQQADVSEAAGGHGGRGMDQWMRDPLSGYSGGPSHRHRGTSSKRLFS